ncbi:hypothetical protein ACFZB5_24160 [Streptomyces nodosus]|uniref:hypothetical protein n=1 Tax=Streptomyces nodosus TaxID=40318 RepID=UPI0036E7C483
MTLPLKAGVSAAAQMATGQRPADERRLLKNAEDEYVAAARALAVCQAGKDIAEQLHDQDTADLLAVLRRQDEQLLETLEADLAQRARAVVAAANGHRHPQAETVKGSEDGGLLEAVMRRARAAMARLRAAFHRGTRRVRDTTFGAWRPRNARMAEKVRGAATREQNLPIPDFSQLGVTEIHKRLSSLSQTELTVNEGYERAHAGRPGVLNAIEHLREAEPWGGYDTMDPERIKMHLADVSDSVALQVLEYEGHHRRRTTVIKAAENALQITPEATHMAEEEVLGAVTREQDLPIPGFSQLNVTEIQQRLRGLSRSALTVIEGYERTHANRRAILDSIEQLRGSKP